MTYFNRINWKNFGFFVIPIWLLIFSFSYVHAGDVIITCVNPGNGMLQLVESADQCQPNETALMWSVAGPKGEPGPVGPQGPAGMNGQNGLDGLSCWDLNGDRVFDPASEDTNGDGVATANDCQGPPGPAGTGGVDVTDGLSCWDLNGNRVFDPATEDTNGDGVATADDCRGPRGNRGPKGDKGDPGADGQNGINGVNGLDGLSCWDLNGNRLFDPALEDTDGDGVATAADCQGPQGPQGIQGTNGLNGLDGLSCWDLNGNRLFDPALEDTNGDGIATSDDCQGPQGPQGIQGVQGTSGILDIVVVQASSLTNSEPSKSVFVACPGGYRVLGGGANLIPIVGGVYLVDNYPLSGSQWWARASEENDGYDDDWSLTVYAICADVDS